jgi:hypothetical protein
MRLDACGEPLAARVQRPKFAAANQNERQTFSVVPPRGATRGFIENFPTKFVVGNQNVAGDRDVSGGVRVSTEDTVASFVESGDRFSTN